MNDAFAAEAVEFDDESEDQADANEDHVAYVSGNTKVTDNTIDSSVSHIIALPAACP